MKYHTFDAGDGYYSASFPGFVFPTFSIQASFRQIFLKCCELHAGVVCEVFALYVLPGRRKKKNNPEGYANLQQIVFVVLGEEAVSRAREVQRGLHPNETEAHIDEEVVANTVPAILSDADTYKELARRVAKSSSKTRQAFETLLQRLEQTFKKAYDRLKQEKSWEQLKQLEQDQAAVKRVRDAYLDALVGMKDNGAFTTLKYSAKDAGLTERRQAEYNDYVQNALEGSGRNKHDTFRLGIVRPEVVIGLTERGIKVAERPVHTMADNDIRHIRNSHGIQKEGAYGVTTGDIQAIPYIVHNADEVYYMPHGNKHGVLYVVHGVDETYYVESIHDRGVFTGKQMIKAPADKIPGAYKEIVGNKEAFIASLNGSIATPQVYAQDVLRPNASNQTIPQPTAKIKTSSENSSGNTVDDGKSVNRGRSYEERNSNQAKYTDNSDIRFSLKDVSAADVETLRRENRKLTEALDAAKAQLKLTNGKRQIKPGAVAAYARTVRRIYLCKCSCALL